MKYVIAVWFALGRLPFPLYRILAAFIAGVLTALLFVGATERRHITLTNLRMCFPKAHVIRRIAWGVQHMYFYVRTFLDRAWLWGGPSHVVVERVVFDNPEALRELQLNKPTIFLAPHFLGLDAAWSRLCLDMRLVTMYSNQKNPLLNNLILQGRAAYGDPVLLSRQQGIRPLISSMKQGRALYYLPDMDFGARDSVFVSFFGHQAATVTAVSRLARLLTAQVVPVTTRYSKGRYIIHVHPPFDNYPFDDEHQSAQFMNHQIEAWVEGNITQYLWLHKRFKTRPNGESRIY